VNEEEFGFLDLKDVRKDVWDFFFDARRIWWGHYNGRVREVMRTSL